MLDCALWCIATNAEHTYTVLSRISGSILCALLCKPVHLFAPSVTAAQTDFWFYVTQCKLQVVEMKSLSYSQVQEYRNHRAGGRLKGHTCTAQVHSPLTASWLRRSLYMELHHLFSAADESPGLDAYLAYKTLARAHQVKHSMVIATSLVRH